MTVKSISSGQTGGNGALPFLTAGWSGATTIVFCLLPCFLADCAVVGPRSIRAGRAAYAEAINQTQDEQILLSIVKGSAYAPVPKGTLPASPRLRQNCSRLLMSNQTNTCVVVMDDDEGLRRSLIRLLRASGMLPVTCLSAEDFPAGTDCPSTFSNPAAMAKLSPACTKVGELGAMGEWFKELDGASVGIVIASGRDAADQEALSMGNEELLKPHKSTQRFLGLAALTGWNSRLKREIGHRKMTNSVEKKGDIRWPKP